MQIQVTDEATTTLTMMSAEAVKRVAKSGDIKDIPDDYCHDIKEENT